MYMYVILNLCVIVFHYLVPSSDISEVFIFFGGVMVKPHTIYYSFK